MYLNQYFIISRDVNYQQMISTLTPVDCNRLIKYGVFGYRIFTVLLPTGKSNFKISQFLKFTFTMMFHETNFIECQERNDRV